jgi:hypothetical protein
MKRNVLVAVISGLVLVSPALLATPAFACSGRIVDLSQDGSGGSAYVVEDNCNVGIEVEVACYQNGLYIATYPGTDVKYAGDTSEYACAPMDTAKTSEYRWWGNDQWNYV